jgi:hypothetical protein
MSELKVNKISPRSGTDVTLGDSGDTFTVPAGASIVNNGTATGFGRNGCRDIGTLQLKLQDSQRLVELDIFVIQLQQVLQ